MFGTERTVGTIRPEGGRIKRGGGKFIWRDQVIGWESFA
jgi:hypothetical protein